MLRCHPYPLHQESDLYGLQQIRIFVFLIAKTAYTCYENRAHIPALKLLGFTPYFRKISLLDGIERFNTRKTSFIAEMNLYADIFRDNEVALIIKQGQFAVNDKETHLQELLAIKNRRLQKLEIAHANFGISTQAEMLMEIDTLKQEINNINSQIGKLKNH